jgi:predicted NBD/HSP70 family sugar kinase
MRISDYELNRLQVLKAIRRWEPVARTDLVKLTGLAGGTITQLTADFVRRGVVIEEKAAGGGLGRPRMGLRINATGGYVLSVFSHPHGRAVMEIVNLRGDPVFSREEPLKRVPTLELRARQLSTLIDETISASPLSKKEISRIGIVVHGVVDNVKGVVHWLATFPDRGVPFAALIEKRLQIPVVIDNDANVIARAEHWFAEEGQLDDFSVMIVDHGVNSAHYVDGMLWTGAHGLNSELGHTKISFGQAQRCYCGMTGCLATYCAIFGIVARVCELRGAQAPPVENLTEAFRQFAAEARDGEPHAREVFNLAGRMLGVAAANMLNERDPGRLIVMAFEPDMIRMISDAFSAALDANTLPPGSGRANVQFKLLDGEHYRKGSAALALEQIYRS